MRDVTIAGVGQTKFGEHWDASIRQLAGGAARKALADARLDGADVGALYVGNMSAGLLAEQEHLAALAADYAGLVPAAATRCEAACASGALAFRQAYLAVAGGFVDTALVLGVEKMTDVKTADANAALMAAGDQEWEASVGLTFAGVYALMARAHMDAFGTTPEQLALVSSINHEHSIGNKNAQFPFRVSVDDVLRSPMVADPLRMLDCSPITDGAAAVILTSKTYAEKPVWVLGSEQASDTVALHERLSFTEMNATKAAARRLFEKTGVRCNDIDVLEVHDCFSINEILALEDLGFCEKGRGGAFVESGEVRVGGSIPTNTTGGLKANGHPVGATGVRQVIDLACQLRGESVHQVRGARYGLALNVGGSGATAAVTLLGAEGAGGKRGGK